MKIRKKTKRLFMSDKLFFLLKYRFQQINEFANKCIDIFFFFLMPILMSLFRPIKKITNEFFLIKKIANQFICNIHKKIKKTPRVLKKIISYLEGDELITMIPEIIQNEGLKGVPNYISKSHFWYVPAAARLLLKIYRHFIFLENEHSLDFLKQRDRKIYFIHFCVWGERYAEKVKNYLIPSLLSKNNLPYLAIHYHMVLLIHCDKSSEEKILTSPIKQELEKYVTLKILIIPPRIMQHYQFYFRLSRLKSSQMHSSIKYFMLGGFQTHAMKIALKEKAFISFLMPDVVLSDSFFRILKEKIEKNKIAFITTTRTNFNKVSDKLCAFYTDPVSKLCLSIPSQDLIDLQVSCLHPVEEKNIVSEKTENFDFCARLIFKTSTGFTIRAFHYHPILVDGEKIIKKIKFDYLPIDNSVSHEFLDENIDYSEQVLIFNQLEGLSIAELTEEHFKKVSVKKYFTYKELVDLTRNVVLKNPAFDTPLNRYFVSFRYQYTSSLPQYNNSEDIIDDEKYIEDIYVGS